MRIFGGEAIKNLMNMLNLPENTAIDHPMITKRIKSAQKRVETFHFDIRKQVLDYDDVINIQREKFYHQRRKVLAGKGLYSDILYMIEQEVDRILGSYISPEMKVEEYNYEELEKMVKELHSIVPPLAKLIEVKDIQNMRYAPMYEKVKDFVIQAYKDHEVEIIEFYNKIIAEYNSDTPPQEPFSDDNVVRQMEKDVLLKVVDAKWIDHLTNVRMLQDSIGLRAYGQKDPLIEYKKECFDLFNKMMFEIQSETVQYLFRTRFGVQVVNPDDIDPDMMV
jgi:preprotein translocase subunit SecA